MKLDTPYHLTEWEWFQLQLKIYSLESRTPAWIITFSYPEPGKVQCAIWSNTTQDLLEKKADREEQLKFYEHWVAAERLQITRLLENIPGLRSEFDANTDMVFDILFHYARGTEFVCRLDADGVHWYLDEPEKLVKKRGKSAKHDQPVENQPERGIGR
jgi:hypothetical protein